MCTADVSSVALSVVSCVCTQSNNRKLNDVREHVQLLVNISRTDELEGGVHGVTVEWGGRITEHDAVTVCVVERKPVSVLVEEAAVTFSACTAL